MQIVTSVICSFACARKLSSRMSVFLSKFKDFTKFTKLYIDSCLAAKSKI